MRYQAIYKASLADGIGWRTVLFVSGCSHKCKGCHNPESWNKDSGELFGRKEIDILIEQLKRPEMDGLTISGGDPLMPYNVEDIEKLCKIIKTLLPEKTIWLYTGYTWDEIKTLSVLKYIDVIVDGKFVLEERDVTLPFKGSKNQNIIDVKRSIKENKLIKFIE